MSCCTTVQCGTALLQKEAYFYLSSPSYSCHCTVPSCPVPPVFHSLGLGEWQQDSTCTKIFTFPLALIALPSHLPSPVAYKKSKKNTHLYEKYSLYRNNLFLRIEEPGLHLKFQLCSSKNRDITGILLIKMPVVSLFLELQSWNFEFGHNFLIHFHFEKQVFFLNWIFSV